MTQREGTHSGDPPENTWSEEKYSVLYSISAYFLNILEYLHIHFGLDTSTAKHLFYGYNQNQ